MRRNQVINKMPVEFSRKYTKLAMLSFLYCLRSEMQCNFSKNSKKVPPVGIEPGCLVIHSDAYLTELTWQVLIDRYLTSLLLVHQLTFRLR